MRKIKVNVEHKTTKEIEVSLPDFRISDSGILYKVISEDKVISIFPGIRSISASFLDKAYQPGTKPTSKEEYNRGLEEILDYLLNP